MKSGQSRPRGHTQGLGEGQGAGPRRCLRGRTGRDSQGGGPRAAVRRVRGRVLECVLASARGSQEVCSAGDGEQM